MDFIGYVLNFTVISICCQYQPDAFNEILIAVGLMKCGECNQPFLFVFIKTLLYSVVT